MKNWSCLFVFSSLLLSTPAFAKCSDQPALVRNYIHSHPDWRLRVLEDMEKDEQAEWRKLNKDACPGFVAVDMEGKGRRYALLLEQPNASDFAQKVVLLGPAGSPDSERVVQPSFHTPVRLVVSRIPPGRYLDRYYSRHLRLRHDGLVVASWGAFATAYYLDNGRMKHFVLSE